MSAIVVDETVARAIREAGEVFQIRDAEGNVIAEAKRKWTDEAAAEHFLLERWPTPEEVERESREGRHYSVEEVLAHLRSLRRES